MYAFTVLCFLFLSNGNSMTWKVYDVNDDDDDDDDDNFSTAPFPRWKLSRWSKASWPIKRGVKYCGKKLNESWIAFSVCVCGKPTQSPSQAFRNEYRYHHPSPQPPQIGIKTNPAWVKTRNYSSVCQHCTFCDDGSSEYNNYKKKNSGHFYSAVSRRQGWAHCYLQDQQKVYI